MARRFKMEILSPELIARIFSNCIIEKITISSECKRIGRNVTTVIKYLDRSIHKWRGLIPQIKNVESEYDNIISQSEAKIIYDEISNSINAKQVVSRYLKKFDIDASSFYRLMNINGYLIIINEDHYDQVQKLISDYTKEYISKTKETRILTEKKRESINEEKLIPSSFILDTDINTRNMEKANQIKKYFLDSDKKFSIGYGKKLCTYTLDDIQFLPYIKTISEMVNEFGVIHTKVINEEGGVISATIFDGTANCGRKYAETDKPQPKMDNDTNDKVDDDIKETISKPLEICEIDNVISTQVQKVIFNIGNIKIITDDSKTIEVNTIGGEIVITIK